MQCRSPVLIGGVNDGTILNQQPLDSFVIVRVCCTEEFLGVFGKFGDQVLDGSCRDEESADFALAALPRIMNRISMLACDSRSAVDEQFYHFDMPTIGGPNDRRPFVTAFPVSARTVVEQK